MREEDIQKLEHKVLMFDELSPLNPIQTPHLSEFLDLFRNYVRGLRTLEEITEFPCHCWTEKEPAFLLKISYSGIHHYICRICKCTYDSYFGRDLPTGRDRISMGRCKVEEEYDGGY